MIRMPAVLPPERRVFADGLEAAAAPSAGIAGFAAPPRETLHRPRLPRGLLDECRRALGLLLPTLEQGGAIGVASAQRGEGRTVTAAAIATVLARDTRRQVVLVDLDFERPGLAELFGVRSAPGLSDHLEHEVPPRLLAGEPERRLWLLPAGNRPPDGVRPYGRFWRGPYMPVLRERFGWVVVDLPPVLETPETTLAGGGLDWTVLAGRYRATSLAAVRRSLELLDVDPERTGFLLSADASRVPQWIRRLL